MSDDEIRLSAADIARRNAEVIDRADRAVAAFCRFVIGVTALALLVYFGLQYLEPCLPGRLC